MSNLPLNAETSASLDATRFEVIGRLAAGIAHEINTPTQYIGDNTAFLQDAFEDLARVLESYRAVTLTDEGAVHTPCQPDSVTGKLTKAHQVGDEADLDYLLDEVPRAIDAALDGIRRVASIASALKSLCHPDGEELEAIDVNEVIHTAVTVGRHEWKYVATIDLSLDPALPHVLCRPGALSQALLNLIVNAAHAIASDPERDPETKGTIGVTTKTTDNEVVVTVTDDGPGVPASIRNRIFVPFFTTKAAGVGTGQGLPLVRDVVEACGGTVALRDSADRGATFVVTLPRGDVSDG